MQAAVLNHLRGSRRSRQASARSGRPVRWSATLRLVGGSNNKRSKWSKLEEVSASYGEELLGAVHEAGGVVDVGCRGEVAHQRQRLRLPSQPRRERVVTWPQQCCCLSQRLLCMGKGSCLASKHRSEDGSEAQKTVLRLNTRVCEWTQELCRQMPMDGWRRVPTSPPAKSIELRVPSVYCHRKSIGWSTGSCDGSGSTCVSSATWWPHAPRQASAS